MAKETKIKLKGRRKEASGEAAIEEIRVGDIVEVHWLDASEATSSLPRNEGEYDTPVVSLGYFLGVKGSRARHVVIAKEIVMDVEFHYNCIPIGMIERVVLIRRGALRGRVARKLVSRLERVPLKRLKRGRDVGRLRL